MKKDMEFNKLKIDFDHKKPEEFILDTFDKNDGKDNELTKILKVKDK